MKFLLQAALIPIFTGIVVAAALWQIRNSETTMSRCNQCGKYAGWNSDTFTKRDAAMNAADLNQSLIARLENEMGILQGALNLSRERAEDAEADLAEARRDLALESHRADDAELERDIARVEAMGLAWELGQLRDALDEHNAQVAVTRYPIAPPPTPRGLSAAAENAARQPTLIESPAVAKIAAELVAVMAENERPPAKAVLRKRNSDAPT
jgi:hypothetical protein